MHLVGWGLTALFWFHPLAWLAGRELAREAEHAADDAVLAQGIQPSDCATVLVSQARLDAPRAALGAGSSMVAARVHAVLGTRSRRPRRWVAWMAAMPVASVTVPALGAWPTWTAPAASLTCLPEEPTP